MLFNADSTSSPQKNADESERNVMRSILIIDSQPLLRSALQREIANDFAGVRLECVEDMLAANAALSVVQFDLVLLNLALRDADLANPFANLREIRRRWNNTRVVVMSSSDDTELIQQAFNWGACGFIPLYYDGGDIRRALHLVLDDGTFRPDEMKMSNASNSVLTPIHLTPRQKEVLNLVTVGRSNKQIAQELNIALQTVKGYVSAIMEVLHVANRTQLTLAAVDIDRRFPGWRLPRNTKLQTTPVSSASP